MPATRDTPAGSHRRLAFLHGFTQTHHSWHECARLIADDLDGASTLVFPDLPGHGLSREDRTTIGTAATRLARVLGPATVVGYSMGGRTALHVALAADNQVERLVLIGATPGLADPTERAARRAADEARAERIESIGVEAFLDEWLAAPLFATLPVERSGLEHRRRNTAPGLMHSLRTAGTGTQESLWGRLGEIEIPVLVLAGELDDKFRAIGREMADRLPNAEFGTIAGAGHAAHSEQPRAVADAFVAWFPGPA